MGSLVFMVPSTSSLNSHFRRHSTLTIGTPAVNFPATCPAIGPSGFASIQRRHCHAEPLRDVDQDSEVPVQDLRVPNHWLNPSKASEESEWLRVTLHKWLDDEYCPEATNVEISKVAAHSYYKSLVEKQTDLGEILLKMAGELESISYQESFHGAFSSANAAVNLIIQRIED
ncbi:unnamed protein product [Ilex paraguariensis]|uniref:Uncharacterized protein n=1 Tax=Ilex paraguariensis TaxID=185542 RepID=A0ABC8U2C8_9AQUA